MKKLRYFLLTAMSLAGIAISASAVVVPVQDDAYTTSSAVNHNHGASPTISINGPSPYRVGYLRYDVVGAMPPGYTFNDIRQATLWIYCETATGNQKIGFHRIYGPDHASLGSNVWLEGTKNGTAGSTGELTANNPPPYIEPYPSFYADVAPKEWVKVDVTAVVKVWVEAETSTHNPSFYNNGLYVSPVGSAVTLSAKESGGNSSFIEIQF